MDNLIICFVALIVGTILVVTFIMNNILRDNYLFGFGLTLITTFIINNISIAKQNIIQNTKLSDLDNIIKSLESFSLSFIMSVIWPIYMPYTTIYTMVKYYSKK